MLLARYAAKRPQGNGDKGYKLILKIKAVALIWVAAFFVIIIFDFSNKKAVINFQIVTIYKV